MPPIAHPVLLDISPELETPRLLLRIPRQGDGSAVCAAVKASYAQLYPWLLWPERLATPELAETEMRRAAAHFILRERLFYLLCARGDGHLVGALTIDNFDWNTPRCELGYWLYSDETGKGYMAEAVRAVTAFCFTRLQMERVEIWCAARNPASARVAQRAGYTLQARVRNAYRDKDGNLTEAECYAALPPAE